MSNIFTLNDYLESYGDIINFAKIMTTVHNSIVYINSDKLLSKVLLNKNIIAIITTKKIINDNYEKLISKDLIESDDPLEDFYCAYHDWLNKNKKDFPSSISDKACIHSSAKISNRNVIIGDNVEIHANAVILGDVIIKRNSIIGPNTTIGYEGFEFMKINGNYKHVKHNGSTILEEYVEVQANSTIEKGIFGQNTTIGKNTKIDNQVLIGHNVCIGENCLITAGVVIGGSVEIGDEVFIGLGSNISNRLKIGNKVKINLGSTVVSNIKDDRTVSGYFAIDHNKYLAERIAIMKASKK